MGFYKRFLSEDSIRNFAKSHCDSFHWFQRYMVCADAYMIEGDWASEIWHKFDEAGKDSEERRKIHQQLVNNAI